MTTPAGYLLDTNVLSEMRRRQPAPQVMAFLEGLDAEQVFLSAVTIGEIHRGIYLTALRDEEKALLLRQWLETQVMPEYGHAILPFDTRTAEAWGLLTGTERSRRQPPSVQDSLIAATAYAHRLTLVTRNTADFMAFPIAVLNPWETP